MIWPDTNFVLALLVPERGREHARALALAEEHGPFVVSESVLVEARWVLESAYAADRRDAAVLLGDALESEHLVAWDPALAKRALALMHDEPRLSVVDCLLAARTLEGDAVLTFDARLARVIERL
jgi:predicted nucleic acid-binding protein